MENADGTSVPQWTELSFVVVPVALAPRLRRNFLYLGIVLALIASGVIAREVLTRRRAGLPPAGSEAYEQATRQFYRGLAQLQVGLIDAATQEFTHAADLAPDEPAVWANLGLAHLRLGDFDAAATAIERAVPSRRRTAMSRS